MLPSSSETLEVYDLNSGTHELPWVSLLQTLSSYRIPLLVLVHSLTRPEGNRFRVGRMDLNPNSNRKSCVTLKKNQSI